MRRPCIAFVSRSSHALLGFAGICTGRPPQAVVSLRDRQLSGTWLCPCSSRSALALGWRRGGGPHLLGAVGWAVVLLLDRLAAPRRRRRCRIPEDASHGTIRPHMCNSYHHNAADHQTCQEPEPERRLRQQRCGGGGYGGRGACVSNSGGASGRQQRRRPGGRCWLGLARAVRLLQQCERQRFTAARHGWFLHIFSPSVIVAHRVHRCRASSRVVTQFRLINMSVAWRGSGGIVAVGGSRLSVIGAVVALLLWLGCALAVASKARSAHQHTLRHQHDPSFLSLALPRLFLPSRHHLISRWRGRRWRRSRRR